MLKKVNQKLIFRLHGISSIPYTKRNLVVKPEEAITDDHISCCICGRKMKNLNAKHLASHDIDMDSYKKLCGYEPAHAAAGKCIEGPAGSRSQSQGECR